MPEETRADALIARCPCGTCEVAIERMPSVRFLCHCTICQQVYPGDYADATLQLAKRVRVLTPEALEFKQLKAPPALDRGLCRSCRHPVVGFLEGPLTPKLAFMPTAVLPDGAPKPRASRHVFYGTRAGDVADSLPKIHGEFMSKLVLSPQFLRVVLGG